MPHRRQAQNARKRARKFPGHFLKIRWARDMVSVEDGPRLVPGDGHDQSLRDVRED